MSQNSVESPLHRSARTKVIKRATQSPKQTLGIYPADPITAGAMGESGTVPKDSYQDLTQLVWKHFAEEITQALQEAQQVLAPAKGRSTTANSQKR